MKSTKRVSGSASSGVTLCLPGNGSLCEFPSFLILHPPNMCKRVTCLMYLGFKNGGVSRVTDGSKGGRQRRPSPPSYVDVHSSDPHLDRDNK